MFSLITYSKGCGADYFVCALNCFVLGLPIGKKSWEFKKWGMLRKIE
jgi:hypothetical protein